MPMYNDESFIQRLKAQDSQAIKSWYLAFFEPLMRQASRFFVQESEQLTAVHNTQLKALNRLDQFQAGTSMEAWLATILRHELIDLYRRNKRWKILSLQTSPVLSEAADFEFDLDWQTEQIHVEQLLKQLPPTTRFVFSFYVFEQLKPREIALELNMNAATVRWHLKMAKQQLKKSLNHD
jgi:RNA polymerase sigma factor (sigma-70 family)